MIPILACVVMLSVSFLPPSMGEVTKGDLADLSYFELQLMRNELYARHGYQFMTPWLADHFERQGWYSPDPRFAPGRTRPSLSRAEQWLLDAILATSEGLCPSVLRCFHSQVGDSMPYEYYRSVSTSPVPGEAIPAEFGEHTWANLGVWSSPVTSSYDVLPDEISRPIFERSDSALRALDSLPQDAIREIQISVEETLSLHRVSDIVYRVYRRPDSSIARVDAVSLGSGYWRSWLDPVVLWTSRFSPDGALRLFRPVYGGGGWTSNVSLVAFDGPPDSTFARCVISGDMERIDMHVYHGPYESVPMTVNLYSDDRDGIQRYRQLTTDES
ncbi:YARHG domain-containing protein [Candidatus Fermentibacteria bacterium]|nr:YARHG domain-containing protein [Candidatus Fermentibacteria bacterium]